MAQEPLAAHDENWEEIARNSAFGLEVEVSGGAGTDIATVKVKASKRHYQFTFN